MWREKNGKESFTQRLHINYNEISGIAFEFYAPEWILTDFGIAIDQIQANFNNYLNIHANTYQSTMLKHAYI